jgi:hypothetical protein
MQGDVDDAHAAANQHQKDVVAGQPAHAGHKAGVSAESNARLRDGGFMVRARDDTVEFTTAASFDGSRSAVDGTAPSDWIDFAWNVKF